VEALVPVVLLLLARVDDNGKEGERSFCGCFVVEGKCPVPWLLLTTGVGGDSSSCCSSCWMIRAASGAQVVVAVVVVIAPAGGGGIMGGESCSRSAGESDGLVPLPPFNGCDGGVGTQKSGELPITENPKEVRR